MSHREVVFGFLVLLLHDSTYTMKFSIRIPGLMLYRAPAWHAKLDAVEMLELARTADQLGYDYIRFSEHVVMEPTLAETMGGRWSHALSSMAFIAGATERIRMRPMVVVPYPHPVEAAKALSTIDFLSGGRVEIIAGTGYVPWEFELLGASHADRGAVTDEYLAAMIELWTADEPSFDGTHVKFGTVVFDP